jgi:hypothetical protein
MTSTSNITLWLPEPDLIRHQALGKACEEASELAKILARCLIQGLDESDPGTGKRNREALFEEIADLDAAVQWLRETINDEYEESRGDRKLNGFRNWGRMLLEHQRSLDNLEGKDAALIGVSSVMQESGGWWKNCSGCYDTEDGHPTMDYAFSKTLGCAVGIGCTECGGLGAVWEYYTEEELAAMRKDIDA